jgi:DNA-binding MarR family transcriptional regulator
MQSLVLSKGAPLYDMLEHIALGPIAEEDWLPFLVRRARAGGRPFASDDAAHALWRRSRPVPFDVQQLAYEAFDQADRVITDAVVERAVGALVRHQAADYAKTFERLSAGQRRVLTALATTPPAPVGSSDFARRVGLADATSVRKALRALEEAELVVRRGTTAEIDDPFFQAWLQDTTPR